MDLKYDGWLERNPGIPFFFWGKCPMYIPFTLHPTAAVCIYIKLLRPKLSYKEAGCRETPRRRDK